MNRLIVLNGQTVSYELQRKNVKNINLRVRADGSVFVSADPRVPIERIEAFIISKSDAILNAVHRFGELKQNAKEEPLYREGDTVKIFGCDKRLRIVCGTKNKAEYDGDVITLTVKDTDDTETKKRLINGLTESLCRDTVTSLCQKVYPLFRDYGVSFPTIKFRRMVSRWGSCRPDRCILTFNYALAKAPISAVEFVVVHEFTHFLVHDHSDRFYAYLSSFIPDWKDQKKLLAESVDPRE